MVNIIVELSKYLMILLMGIYTFSCFSVFAHNYESEQRMDPDPAECADVFTSADSICGHVSEEG